MAPKLKLIYFPLEGRAECIRMVCAAGGLPLEEEIIQFEDWPRRKQELLFQQVPVLMVEDSMITEHVAICRYTAKLANLTGKNQLEDAKIDAIVDACNDLYSVGANLIFLPVVLNSDREDFKKYVRNMVGDEAAKKYEGHPETKAAGFKEYQKTFNPLLDKFENILSKNQTGWFVGDKMTWADIYVGEFMHRRIAHMEPTALEGHPNMKALVKKVYESPRIAEYKKNSPNYGY